MTRSTGRMASFAAVSNVKFIKVARLQIANTERGVEQITGCIALETN